MSTIKQASFGHLAAAMIRARGWSPTERAVMMAILERAEPAKGWSTDVSLRDVAALAECSHASAKATVARAVAMGVLVREGQVGGRSVTRIVSSAWLALATAADPGHHMATPRLPYGHPQATIWPPPGHQVADPGHHMAPRHVIGASAGPRVAAPLSDPLSDPPSRTRESAPTHTRTHATEPSPVQPPKAPTFEDEVREMCDLALGCKPPITRRGTHVGLMLSSSETQEVARLVETHGVAAVRDVLRECGGAEMPVAMAAKRLKAAAVVGRPQAHVPFEQPAQRSQRPQDLTPEELDHKLALWDRLWKEAGLDGTVAHS